MGDNRADAVRLRMVEGYNVDDDNDPAPENIPNQNQVKNIDF